MTYTSLRLRMAAAKYSWALWLSLIAVVSAFIIADARMALAVTCICLALGLFIWTRLWVYLCSVPTPPHWAMDHEWMAEPQPGVLLHVDFTLPERPSLSLDVRQADIKRADDHGKNIVLHLAASPHLLIVPCDCITPQLRNKLLQ